MKHASAVAQRSRLWGVCLGGIECSQGKLECWCDCNRCGEHEHHDCRQRCGKGGFCRPSWEHVFDCVLVCPLAVVSRSRLNERGAAATRAALAAETVLMARARREGMWSGMPRDVALLIANMLLLPCGLRVRRRRD